nr:UDP-N-acetylglucosamine 2-epimerase (non-hydrolyzing) [Halanaerobacter jeridensis]
MSVIGTRPEAIKMAPLIEKLKQEPNIDSVLTVTAQHRELLDQVLDLFSLKVDHDLNLMSAEQSLTDLTIKVLVQLKEIIIQEEPDLVLVHGDTTTTFAAALASFYQKCAVAHIEAGLRSYNKYEPYPEEINRRLTGTLADLHFAPTVENYNNLLEEGVSADKVFITGNTVIDAVLTMVQLDYHFDKAILNDIALQEEKIILVTAHRRENLGQALKNICCALKRIAESNPAVKVIWPVHPNPKVKEIVYKEVNNIDNIMLLEALNYQDFINLMARSYLVVSDSGGLQEEAPALNKAVLVLRDRTERQAGLKAGTLKLVGTATENIIAAVEELLHSEQKYQQMISVENPYGDGQASKRIVDYLQYYFSLSSIKPNQFS